MSVRLLVLLLPVAAVLVGVVLVLAVIGSRQVPPVNTPTATLVAARRHENLTTALAVVSATLAVVTVQGVLGAVLYRVPTGAASGLAVALFPFVATLVFLAVHAVGERTWPRPVGAVRTASLARRGVRDLAPARARLLSATFAVGAVAVVVFGVTADETGRAVPLRITAEMADRGVTGGASGPYPGWPYGGPILVALALVGLATVGVLGLVSRRPAVVGTRPEDDRALRQTSARRVLGGVQVLIGATVAGMLLVAAGALGNSGRPAVAWTATAVAGVLGVASAVAGLTSFVPVQPDGAGRPGPERGGPGVPGGTPALPPGEAAAADTGRATDTDVASTVPSGPAPAVPDGSR